MKWLKLLAFPVVALVFMLGWIMYIIGERKERPTFAEKRKQ